MKYEFMTIYYYVYPDNKMVVKDNKYYQIEGDPAFLVRKLDEFGLLGWEVVGTTNGLSAILLQRKL
ncbi:MAG: hypothetical protein FWC93_04640 [Defluviitaleaceae bacterium]|nr:hypothetical protein [Defluviitaleaceae bacterium]